ncbi:alpha/beta hydrolase [Egbenema bharatensis]|uniref:alpha/beta hydrolase n=1 Tax=Egbenema bharatensis TaxID=3463334 RepID=UPI003A8AEB97
MNRLGLVTSQRAVAKSDSASNSARSQSRGKGFGIFSRLSRSPWWILAGLSLPLALNASSVQAAQTVTLTYGAIERSIAVESLEVYARTGETPSDLRGIVRHLSPQQREDFRQMLSSQVDLTPTAVAQFLYTEQGEILLRRLSEVIRTQANLPGFYAIRSALIAAAAEPENGLTMINVLREFPLTGLRVDLNRSLQLMGQLEDLVTQTQDAMALIQEQSTLEAEFGRWIPFDSLPDLRVAGDTPWEVYSFDLTDSTRSRSFPVDLYLPRLEPDDPAAPLIVISHGLGSDRTTYAYLAAHLASYGFAVAVPEHPGSNATQMQALISGTASQVTSPAEFIDRPLDITYLLDHLETLSERDPDFQGRLDVQRVGVIGQSMGGYTALVLAGADLNFDQLEAECTGNSFNLSLLLQCRALDLPRSSPPLKDERVQAVVAINPIGSSLLGQEDYAAIQVPVLIVSSSSDTVAPALLEQIRPFTWLRTPNRYLAILEGGTHFSAIDIPNPEAIDSGEVLPLPPQVIGPDPALAHTYLRSLSLAFMGNYVAADNSYQFYLNPAYAQRISQETMPIRLVRSLTPTQLTRALTDSVIELIVPRSIGSGTDTQPES